MNTVRIARDCGNIATLLPDGLTDLRDIPFTLHDAIVAALYFLGFEELPREERPPKTIWMDNEAMRRWWDEVERTREAKYGGGGDTGGGSMSRNSFADELIG